MYKGCKIVFYMLRWCCQNCNCYSIAASPIRVQRKRLRPEPLYILPHPHPMFQSRLRSPRMCTASPPPPYTPPPMLSPARNGQGLFWQAVTPTTAASSAPASSTTLTHCKSKPEFLDCVVPGQWPIQSDCRTTHSEILCVVYCSFHW